MNTYDAKETPQNTYRFMAVVAVVLILLFSLAIYSLSKTTSQPWVQPLKAPQIQSTLHLQLPQFEFSIGKTSFKPENFKGHWTLLSFWSVTSPLCIAELPALDRLQQNWQGPDFQIITVNADHNIEDLESSKHFLEENQISLQTVFDKESRLKNAFNVSEFPKHFLIDPDATIVWEAHGAYRWNDGTTRDQLLRLMEQRNEEPGEPEE